MPWQSRSLQGPLWVAGGGRYLSSEACDLHRVVWDCKAGVTLSCEGGWLGLPPALGQWFPGPADFSSDNLHKQLSFIFFFPTAELFL